MLCSECHNYFFKRAPNKGRKDWKNVWPSFYWDLLTGIDVVTGNKFYESYKPIELWRFIPRSIRGYWVDSLVNEEAYREVLQKPQIDPHFVDRTLEVNTFCKDIAEMSFKGMLRALDPSRVPGHEDNKPMVIPDVLCPWGCSEFSFRTSVIDPSLLLQHHLRRVHLNFPSKNNYERLHLVETSRLDYF